MLKNKKYILSKKSIYDIIQKTIKTTMKVLEKYTKGGNMLESKTNI